MEKEQEKDCCTSRPQYWKECSIEEKIERTRQAVKSIQNELAGLMDLVNRLEVHKHLNDEILIPLEGSREQTSYKSYGGARMRHLAQDDEVYF